MRALWLSGMLILMLSCSTDFALEADFQDVPVVYGFVEVGDTAHYLRVERMLLEAGADAAVLAQDPERLYYRDLSVVLEDLRTGRQFPLTRVDGNGEGYPRAAGPFATAPNYLYKLPASAIGLRGGETVQLRLDRGAGLPEVTAGTLVLEPLEIRDNSPFDPVNMRYDRTVRFSWGAGPGAEVFEVRLRIRYQENATGAPADWTPASVDWVLAERLLREGDAETQTVAIQGEAFYRFLGSALAEKPSTVRRFEGFDLIVVAGGEEFLELLRIDQANSGITSAQLTPRYSNVEGGVGVFASRATLQRENLTLTGQSLDSLRNGQFTRRLNFE